MYNIVYTEESAKILAKWKKSNSQLFKKTIKMVADISLHPTTGVGHPEALVGHGGDIYSRRISANDRIIYRVKDSIVTVVILTLGGHYGDK